MKKWTVEFDTADNDTCTDYWTFHMKEEEGRPIIESVKIDRDRQGCVGHPKTITALMKNIPVDALDVGALAETTCVREQSCGMNLGSFIQTIRESQLQTES